MAWLIVIGGAVFTGLLLWFGPGLIEFFQDEGDDDGR